MTEQEYKSNLDHATMLKKYFWRVGVYIEDAELARRIRVCAAEEDLNYSELVVQALREYLDKRDGILKVVADDPRIPK